MQVGDKVYPLKIDVSLDKDRVVFQIVECDSCNGAEQPSFFKSEVILPISKRKPAKHRSVANRRYDRTGPLHRLGEMIRSKVAKEIRTKAVRIRVASRTEITSRATTTIKAAGNRAAPAPEPQQIEKGQTPEQVKAALGNPEKIVNLGAKMMYVYKDIKVRF